VAVGIGLDFGGSLRQLFDQRFRRRRGRGELADIGFRHAGEPVKPLRRGRGDRNQHRRPSQPIRQHRRARERVRSAAGSTDHREFRDLQMVGDGKHVGGHVGH
jgi:hypothetical protein